MRKFRRAGPRGGLGGTGHVDSTRHRSPAAVPGVRRVDGATPACGSGRREVGLASSGLRFERRGQARSVHRRRVDRSHPAGPGIRRVGRTGPATGPRMHKLRRTHPLSRPRIPEPRQTRLTSRPRTLRIAGNERGMRRVSRTTPISGLPRPDRTDATRPGLRQPGQARPAGGLRVPRSGQTRFTGRRGRQNVSRTGLATGPCSGCPARSGCAIGRGTRRVTRNRPASGPGMQKVRRGNPVRGPRTHRPDHLRPTRIGSTLPTVRPRIRSPVRTGRAVSPGARHVTENPPNWGIPRTNPVGCPRTDRPGRARPTGRPGFRDIRRGGRAVRGVTGDRRLGLTGFPRRGNDFRRRGRVAQPEAPGLRERHPRRPRLLPRGDDGR